MAQNQKKEKRSLGDKIDSFIGIFSPRAEYKRRMYRKVNKFALKGTYSGASRDRLRVNWLPGGGSPDEDLLQDLPDLRERSRDLNRNDGIAAGVTTTMLANVIGTGIKPQSRIDRVTLGMELEPAREFQRKAERIWQKWERFADAGQRMAFWEIQHLVKRQILENGESVIIPEMLEKPGRPYFLALNVIEADRLDTPSDKYSERNIRRGVEIGERGEPIAYWICKTHPGDMTYTRRRPDAREYIRYEAFNKYGWPNVFHLYWVKRPGQTRGEPFFAPVITRFKDLADYMEAELVAARVAACFALFIEKGDAETWAAGKSSETNAQGQRLETIEPGMIEYLNNGEKINSFNPNRPGGTFDPFVDKVLRFIGAGLNLPYELVIKDFSKTNYSSARAAILEARKMFKMYQVWMAERLCQPSYEMLMDEAFLRGELEASNYFENRSEYTRTKWIAPGWGYIDPEKEINASKTAIDNHLSSLADECGAHGRDWEEVMEQRAREEEKRKELGLPESTKKEPVAVGKTNKKEDSDDTED